MFSKLTGEVALAALQTYGIRQTENGKSVTIHIVGSAATRRH